MTHLPKIIIRCVDPDNQRYETCGDWLYDAEENILTISVSRMADMRSELAVALHEAFEAVLCLHNKVDQTAVDQFDFQFEQERAKGMHEEGAEAGDSPQAPYRKYHQMATAVERQACIQMSLDWDVHDANVNE